MIKVSLHLIGWRFTLVLSYVHLEEMRETMDIYRASKFPGVYSRKAVRISAEQFTSDIANAYATGEHVVWETPWEDDDVIGYTVIVTHDEGHTTYNWEEAL